MGIYDRDYYQEQDRGRFSGGGRSVVINLVLVNAAIYIADLVFDQRISSTLALRSDLFQRPWQCWQLITYGFVHDPEDLKHILFNMFGLWLFGSDTEAIYGKAEFLRFYLVSIVVAGLVWVVSVAWLGGTSLVGASGGVMAVMMLFVLHFPRRLLYIWGVLPVPAWGIAAFYLLVDILGVGDAGSQDASLVAHTAHLGGAAFGTIYFLLHINLGRLIPRRLSASSFRFRPRLRIHDPQDDSRDLSQKVDQILEKISREGESSLTKTERRTLEEASRRYQRRRE